MWHRALPRSSSRTLWQRSLTMDHRQRLSRQYLPITKERTEAYVENASQSHAYLLQGGFLRQSSSGTFTFLPMGLRVLEKIERIIQQEMDAVGGQKLMMPLLLHSEHWKATGRWDTSKGEFFRFQDRKQVDYLLAPTHEEEITTLVAQDLRTSKQLPLRLYQIGRKYRDELRPRAGLLRGREFMMKDMYSFDKTPADAFVAYDQIAQAYAKIFQRVGVPYLVAEADSGNIGGSKSHEYHLVSPIGEDTLLTCHHCGYTANEELAEATYHGQKGTARHTHLVYTADQGTRKGSALVLTPQPRAPNLLKVASDLKQHLQSAGLLQDPKSLQCHVTSQPTEDETPLVFVDDTVADPALPQPIGTRHYRLAASGDGCHHCAQPLGTVKAIEVAHTFYLGTTYSAPLKCTYQDDKTKVPVEMGCYGIGLSRLLAAVAEAQTDMRGLVWPASIAPYKLCVIATDDKRAEFKDLANKVYDDIQARAGWANDVVLDDRRTGFGRKMTDAELLGFPYIMVLGRKALESNMVELHQRQLGKDNKKSMIPLDQLASWLDEHAS
ncbi:prolyl-tRNA synthetase [Hesseltinella vesiculosa]|uniref:Probable proline--tRNA ligase, mitochondrial n=1 Tax=Hesseltinella vesiculosa TaxID=101127 RepID=A0A1X2GPC6_9FUNG|nr:prolyl-tRNA synthetase [Hesseltinella vesiculosa]